MSRVARGYVAILVGAVTARLVWDGGFGWFVHQRMRIPLALAALALIAIGAADVWHASKAYGRAAPQDHSEDGTDHEHHRHGRVGWLLAAPALVLLGVAPTALGPESADRMVRYSPSSSSSRLPPLAPEGTLALTLAQFQTYAADAPDELGGRTVELTGFVVNDGDVAPGGFLLTRFMIGCCAADAFALQVAAQGAPATWDDGTWVTVTGTVANASGESSVPAVRVLDVVEIPEPDAPYESLW